MSIELRIRSLEERLVPCGGDPGQRFRSLLFKTSGQFAAALPPGVLPTMPVDVFARPHLQASSHAADDRLGMPIHPAKIMRPD